MENSTTLEVSVLSVFDITKQQLESFLSDYKNLVITEENIKEAIKARAAIREKRYAIQAQQKSNDDKRIAWNKKAMADNKAAAEELLALITPIEEPIDQKIKDFEAKKEAEKQAKIKAEQERVDARVKRIEATGATKTDISYVLGGAYIAHEEFASLSDNIFDRIVASFETEAKEIAEKKAEEDARIKAEEEEKARIKAEQESKLKADQEEVARKQKEQEEKDAQLAAEREKIEADKRAIREEKINSRKTALFNLGMAATADGFVFGDFMISMKSIEETENWDHHYNETAQKVSALKSKRDEELKAKAEQEQKEAQERREKEAARLEALRPDEEKLNDFVRSLGNITGPELSTEEGRGILEHAISQIRDTQAFIRESLNALRNE